MLPPVAVSSHRASAAAKTTNRQTSANVIFTILRLDAVQGHGGRGSERGLSSAGQAKAWERQGETKVGVFRLLEGRERSAKKNEVLKYGGHP